MNGGPSPFVSGAHSSIAQQTANLFAPLDTCSKASMTSGYPNDNVDSSNRKLKNCFSGFSDVPQAKIEFPPSGRLFCCKICNKKFESNHERKYVHNSLS